MNIISPCLQTSCPLLKMIWQLDLCSAICTLSMESNAFAILGQGFGWSKEFAGKLLLADH